MKKFVKFCLHLTIFFRKKIQVRIFNSNVNVARFARNVLQKNETFSTYFRTLCTLSWFGTHLHFGLDLSLTFCICCSHRIFWFNFPLFFSLSSCLFNPVVNHCPKKPEFVRPHPKELWFMSNKKRKPISQPYMWSLRTLVVWSKPLKTSTRSMGDASVISSNKVYVDIKWKWMMIWFRIIPMKQLFSCR